MSYMGDGAEDAMAKADEEWMYGEVGEFADEFIEEFFARRNAILCGSCRSELDDDGKCSTQRCPNYGKRPCSTITLHM